MKTININIRARPLRFAFLVRPSDKNSLLKIFRINTILWGGEYNLIIPFFDSKPSWWSKYYESYTAKQIICGYLDYYEPDFIVEAKKGMAKNLGFHASKIIALGDLLAKDSMSRFLTGSISTDDLYRYFYREEFQFVHRDKPPIFIAETKDKALKAFAACLFGSFPDNSLLSHFRKNYCDVFSPEVLDMNLENLLEVYRSAMVSPLQIGAAKLKVNYNNDDSRMFPTLFVLDLSQPRDLIDFWNLRSQRNNILAIPKQWLPALSELCKNFILENYHPLIGNNNGVMVQPRTMFSRSIGESESQKLYELYIKVDKQGANVIQLWYPAIWAESPQYTARRGRPLITANQKSIEVPIESDGSIKFETLSPKFNDRDSTSYGYKMWANTITLSDLGQNSDIATVFPADYKQSLYPQLSGRFCDVTPMTEGLVIYPLYANSTNIWYLFNGTKAFEEWLKHKNISISLSQSGRATKQIIETLGSLTNVQSIANQEVIKLLDQVARSENKSMQIDEFRNKINGYFKNTREYYIPNKDFEILVQKKVVELGLEVNCNKCNQWCWYPLDKLDEMVVCTFCLKEFLFPTCNPGENCRWAYRVIGPFALRKFAEGGYGAALSIHFFSDIFSPMLASSITWAAGLKLEFEKSEATVEVDYLIWYKKRDFSLVGLKPKLIFGESKSFSEDSITKEEIDKMQYLGSKFPGSVLAFSVMKEKLSPSEIKLLKGLANWGRRLIGVGKKEMQAHVVILTARELFCPQVLSSDEKYEENSRVLNGDLENLAQLTQKTYLGLPSYGEAFNEKRNKKKLIKK